MHERQQREKARPTVLASSRDQGERRAGRRPADPQRRHARQRGGDGSSPAEFQGVGQLSARVQDLCRRARPETEQAIGAEFPDLPAAAWRLSRASTVRHPSVDGKQEGFCVR